MQNTIAAIPRLVRQPAELKAARQALGLSAEQLAQVVRVEGGGRTVRRWEAGEREIPGPVIVVMETAMDFLVQRDAVMQQLDLLQSGKMRSGGKSWLHPTGVDTTETNIAQLLDHKRAFDSALEILIRLPPPDTGTSERVHWYHLRRMTPKNRPPEVDDWSLPGETSIEAALAYFEDHSGLDRRLVRCEDSDTRVEFTLEKRLLLRTQHGASQRLQAGELVQTFYVRSS